MAVDNTHSHHVAASTDTIGDILEYVRKAAVVANLVDTGLLCKGSGLHRHLGSGGRRAAFGIINQSHDRVKSRGGSTDIA
ncbi:hypothetical protein CTA2_351 [Colletotrichum tanaceti]|uniref:Uncharacterized protein n=1 Tax=Colletotrichum tanaceti TaxID=1306861 RepID=A0A4U6XIN2_9PEZI|nr:hypothetical protein CTA2_351 [Colletotrichum tanaceti]TKW53957.1 hypothetical protein CTA1_2863 [Colletotrichum tanaceti]